MEAPINPPPQDTGDEKPSIWERTKNYIVQHPLEITLLTLTIYGLARKPKKSSNPNINKTVVKFN